jgi:hypothetical protein
VAWTWRWRSGDEYFRRALTWDTSSPYREPVR